MKKINTTLLLAIIFALPSCYYRHAEEVVPACDPAHTVSYEAVVAPIINSKCSIPGCHNGSNVYVPYLTKFSEVQANSSDILSQLSNNAMPPAGNAQLTPVELAKIQCWINQGAKAP